MGSTRAFCLAHPWTVIQRGDTGVDYGIATKYNMYMYMYNQTRCITKQEKPDDTKITIIRWLIATNNFDDNCECLFLTMSRYKYVRCSAIILV